MKNQQQNTKPRILECIWSGQYIPRITGVVLELISGTMLGHYWAVPPFGRWDRAMSEHITIVATHRNTHTNDHPHLDGSQLHLGHLNCITCVGTHMVPEYF